LSCRFQGVEEGKTIRRYWTGACKSCALKAQCTKGTERRISRWEHEAVLEKFQSRLDSNPGAMGVRRQTAEHPFGTIKCWMGATHFLMRAYVGVDRDGAQPARLQHEARDSDCRRWRSGRKPPGASPGSQNRFRAISPLGTAKMSAVDAASHP
jgi:hypothetical protein